MLHTGSSGTLTPTNDIIFEAYEDLFWNSNLVLTKGGRKKISIVRPRVASSYCYEFWGIVGVPFSTVAFKIDAGLLQLDNYITRSCLIHVCHDTKIPSENTLQPALSSLLTSGLNSDIEIRVEDKVFKAHKCILMCRSPKFWAMFNTNMAESSGQLVINDQSGELFERMLTWIYTGQMTMPETIEAVC